ncbi:MAG: tetratricopeptide repeat protein [Terracidiphilus sp.]
MPSFFPCLLISILLAAPLAAAQGRFESIASQADAARVQDRVQDAIRLYREGTHLRPSWSDGWWYLGSLLYDQDRFTEADAAFQHQLSSTSHRGPAYAFLGLCEYETGKYDEALAQLRAWAKAGWASTPELRDVAVYHFALLLTRDGRFVESLYLLASMAPRLGDTPELSEAMGLASLRMRNLPGDYSPEQRERIWLAGKAALYAAQSPKDFERADEFAARLESHYPEQPEVHYFRGTLYGFEGKTAEAEREYRNELKISPNHAPALVALAIIDLEKADLAEAEFMARRAVEADSSYGEAHHVLGRVLLESGDLQASARELETAKRLAPGSPTVRSHLAIVYSKLGRTQEAKAESAAFLTLKKKEEAMAPVKEKLGENPREKAH